MNNGMTLNQSPRPKTQLKGNLIILGILSIILLWVAYFYNFNFYIDVIEIILSVYILSRIIIYLFYQLFLVT